MTGSQLFSLIQWCAEHKGVFVDIKTWEQDSLHNPWTGTTSPNLVINLKQPEVTFSSWTSVSWAMIKIMTKQTHTVQFQLVTNVRRWWKTDKLQCKSETTGWNKSDIFFKDIFAELWHHQHCWATPLSPLWLTWWRSSLPVRTWGQLSVLYLRGFLKPTRVQPVINKDGHCISLYSFSLKNMDLPKGAQSHQVSLLVMLRPAGGLRAEQFLCSSLWESQRQTQKQLKAPPMQPNTVTQL